MSNHPLPVQVHTDAMKTIRRALYQEPSCRQTDVQFSTYLRQHVLGFFVPCQKGRVVNVNKNQFGEPNLLFKNVPSPSSTDSCITDYSSENEPDDPLKDQPLRTSTIQTSAELISRKKSKTFHLKNILAAHLAGDSLWLCGWNVSIAQNKDFVLMKTMLPEYNVVIKRKKRDANADLPMNMFPFEDKVNFYEEG